MAFYLKMRNLIVTLFVLFLSFELSAQSYPFEKIEKEIAMYKDLPNYVLIQKTEIYSEFLDTFKINFNHLDSLILVMPIESTYAFANLFMETDFGYEKQSYQEGDAFDFLRFVVYRSKNQMFRIQFKDCFSNATIVLEVVEDYESN